MAGEIIKTHNNNVEMCDHEYERFMVVAHKKNWASNAKTMVDEKRRANEEISNKLIEGEGRLPIAFRESGSAT